MSPACPSVTDTDDFIKLSNGAPYDRNRTLSLQSTTNEPLMLFEGGAVGGVVGAAHPRPAQTASAASAAVATPHVKPQFVEVPYGHQPSTTTPRQPSHHRSQEAGGVAVRGGAGQLISEESFKSMMGTSATTLFNETETGNGGGRPAKPKFRFPAQTHQTASPASVPTSSSSLVGVEPRSIATGGGSATTPITVSPRKVTKYPTTKLDVIQPLRLGCNDVMHPDDAKFIATAALGETSNSAQHSAQRSRPNTARSATGDGPSARLYPQRAPAQSSASARPPSATTKSSLLGGGRSTTTPQAPLIQYSGLTSNPSFVTSDLDRLQPPTYSPRLARPPSAPAFPYQRKTLEMSHQTDTLLQEAVDKATHITSRIVSNLRQRRLVTSQATGGRKGDGRVFLTLEQQPLPQELVRAVAMSSASPRKRDV